MKLIPLIILIISTTVNVKSNEHYTFPPQFQAHHSSVMSPDRTVYLPPESQTTVPYYPMKNLNLPFPYLPSTATKAPAYFSTPFPMMMSSTLLSINDDDDNDEDEKPSPPVPRNIRTERSPPQQVEKREMRPQQMKYQPIDRIDMKPFGFTANPIQMNNPVQKATPRSLIISPPDAHNDAMDQYKMAAASAFSGPHYIPAPNVPGVYLSSTTETAIPIVRLSNEMDLDGSFSYEALGADQTHYVQHSHMENMGSEKQEQVVEGSYSYVGDNGQTYTVHYIADSNGFRASGDHLPVAPPIPEIIQRSIQYNLAEEAKKPPHMKSWQNDENELSESERQRYAISPPRSLFTGKTPESFSFAFSQGSQNTQNNLTPAASSQTPIKANVDFTSEQMKGKTNNGISPQITFLASQGAHVPSANPQQTIGRLFTSERSTMPQLMNYEAGVKESDESNKALWRWQYGLNANIDQAPEKNSISRSFGEGDEVMMNFNDMTPQQYTSMIQSQLEPNNGLPQNEHRAQTNENIINQRLSFQGNENNIATDLIPTVSSTEGYYVSSQAMNWYQNNNHYDSITNNNQNLNENSKSKSLYVPDNRAKLVTQDKFIPPSQTVTHSYNYEETQYEPQKIRPSTIEPINLSTVNEYPAYNTQRYEKPIPNNIIWPNKNQIQNEQLTSSTEAQITSTTIVSELKFSDFVIDNDNNNNNNEFKPIYKSEEVTKRDENIEESEENTIRDNIFLKKIFSSGKAEQFELNKENIKIRVENKAVVQPKMNVDHKQEKTPKFITAKSKPSNEIQTMKKKPFDMADVMNFISYKNHFESAKTRPKPKQIPYNHRNEMRFIPVQDRYEPDDNVDMERSSSDLRSNYYQPEELRGIIKNYKVLQRNNSSFNAAQEAEQLKRDLSPPPVKILQSSNLPPLGRAGPSTKSYLPPIYV